MNLTDIRNLLSDKGLKVTPQRTAVLETIIKMKNHPTADQVIEHVRESFPNLATGTVYKILDVFFEKGMIRKVKTDKDIMRYDADIEPHHHLYCLESDRIEDYTDIELSHLLNDYFNNKKIPGFRIEDVKLQIIGRFQGEKQMNSTCCE